MLTSVLIFGLSLGLLSGLSGEMLDERNLVTPNLGIRRSARNSVLAGVFFGLIIGLDTGLVSGLVLYGGTRELLYGFLGGVVTGLVFGFLSGVVAALFNGGLACIQHMILRLLLWYAGFIPRNYPRFLDYATERILLRKVGGGYIFVHRLLLEYFATLDTALVSQKEVEQAQSASPAT